VLTIQILAWDRHKNRDGFNFVAFILETRLKPHPPHLIIIYDDLKTNKFFTIPELDNFL
jgi:hypothetical protein